MAFKHLFHQHIDTVLSTNEVNILANVVITKPIWVNIVLKTIISKGLRNDHVKDEFYHDQYPRDTFCCGSIWLLALINYFFTPTW
jgi:hypothetical protein